MSSRKDLYILLKEADRIKEEKYINKPARCREKMTGYIWDGKLEVITKDDLRFIFHFWVNCHDDDGVNWYPDQELLNSMWRCLFVPQERLKNDKLFDANWHLLYVDDHIYVSKTGFFDTESFDYANFKSVNKKRDRIEESIRSGTWEQNNDIWMII